MFSDKEPEEKKRILSEEFLIPMDRELEREVERMCNLGQGMLERGYHNGMQQGLQKGLDSGIEMAKRVMKLAAAGLPREQIATEANATMEQVKKILDD